MSLANIRSALKSILEGVPGIGVVYDYKRYSHNWSNIKTLFGTPDGKINGWMITRKATPANRTTLGEYERQHVMIIHGVYGLRDEDASENVFQDLVEAIVFEVNDHDDLNETCLTICPDWGPMNGAEGVQVQNVDERMFGNILCHYAELRIGAVETMED